MKRMFRHIMRNFFTRPATRLYPEVSREPFERTRGRIYFESENCIYCGICQRKCPPDAIRVDKPSSTWELDPLRCIVCGECVNVCPKKCISMTNERRSCKESKEIITITKEKQ